jgi:hypothetical protein
MQEEINDQNRAPQPRGGRARAIAAAVIGAGALAVGIPAAVAIADAGSSSGSGGSGSYFAPAESAPSFIQSEDEGAEPRSREDCPEKDGRRGGSDSQTAPGESL